MSDHNVLRLSICAALHKLHPCVPQVRNILPRYMHRTDHMSIQRWKIDHESYAPPPHSMKLRAARNIAIGATQKKWWDVRLHQEAPCNFSMASWAKKQSLGLAHKVCHTRVTRREGLKRVRVWHGRRYTEVPLKISVSRYVWVCEFVKSGCLAWRNFWTVPSSHNRWWMCWQQAECAREASVNLIFLQ